MRPLPKELGDAVNGVCTGEEPPDLSFKLFVVRSEDDVFCLGLCIAYVMYRAKARKDSAEGCIVRIDLKAPIKYWSVSGINVSPLSASSHFLTMPIRSSVMRNANDDAAYGRIRDRRFALKR